MFTGKTLQELNALVDTTLAIYGRMDTESKPRICKSLYGSLCTNCNFSYEDHGAFNDACPNGETKFQEQRCEFPIPLSADQTHAAECGEECVKGTKLCEKHYSEELL